MKKRLQGMIGDIATCFMGTFHGFCNLILKKEIHGFDKLGGNRQNVFRAKLQSVED